MAIFDNELINNVASPEPAPLPHVDLSSQETMKVDTSMGGFENFAANAQPPSNTGLGIKELSNLNVRTDQSSFSSPFQMISGKELSENKRYDMYQRDTNLENIHGLNQGWASQLANGIVKMAVTGVGTFAQGFATIPNTISSAKNGIKALSGDPNGYEGTIDNWLKNIEDIFPNYFSDKEKEHPYLAAIPFFTGSANFWGDKIIKNLGFTVGAIGSAVVQDLAIGAVTEGIGEIPLLGAQIGKASLWLNKLFNGSEKLDKVLDLARGLGKTEQQIFNIKGLAQAAAATKLSNGFRYGMNVYGSARTEAGVEARDGYRQVRQQLLDQYKLDNLGTEATGADAQEIEDYATDAMNTRFGLNMAILTVSNAIQFDNLFKSFSKAGGGITGSLTKDLEGAGKLGLKKGSLDEFERKAATGIGGKVWEFVEPKIPNILSEGVYEEGGQYAVEKGTYDYYTRKYKDPNRKSNVDSWNQLNEVLTSTNKGLAEQFGTSEGLENMFVGALSALVSGGIMGKIDQMRGQGKEARLQSSINILNQYSLTGILHDKYANTLDSVGIAKEMKAAAKNNDVYEYKNLKDNLFFGFVNSRIPSGMHETTIEQLKLLKDLSKEEFEKTFGMDFNSSNKKTVDEYVDTLITKANDIKDTHDVLDSTYKNPYKAIVDPKTKEEAIESTRNIIFNSWKTELGYNLSIVPNANRRLASIEQDVTKINPLLDNDILAKLTHPDSLKELSKTYEEKANQLSKTITDYTTPENRKATKEQIKALRSQSEKINLAINKDEINTSLFNGLLNFELNNQDATKSNIIGAQHSANLFNIGVDVNKLNIAKKTASERFDNLTKREGFEQYFQGGEDIAAGKAPDIKTDEPIVDEPPIVSTPQFTNKVGVKENIDLNREYQIPTSKIAKVDKVDKVADDRWQVTAPNGDITFHATEEKAKEIADELNSDFADLGKVKVLAINEDGTIKVEDLSGNIQNISPDVLSGYERIETRQEQLLKFAAKVDKEQKDLENNSGEVGTKSNDADLIEIQSSKSYEDSKKAANILFTSSTTESEGSISPTGAWIAPVDSAPHVVRAREFLTNAPSLNNRKDLRAILVTYNNETALGLKGISALSYKRDSEAVLSKEDVAAISSVNTGFLAQVFVTKDGQFIDKEGNEIGKIGEPVDLSKIVFQTQPTIALKGLAPNGKEYNLYRNTQEKEAIEEQKAYIEFRKGFFEDVTGVPTYYDFSISNGLAIKNEIDGKEEKNNAIETLAPGQDYENILLTQQGLITVSIKGRLDFKGESRKFPKGRPVFQFADTQVSLSNSKFNKQSVKTIYELLKTVSENVNELSRVRPQMNFLQNVLFWKSGKKDRTANQISIDVSTMDLYIGNNKFDISNIENLEDEISELLLDVYSNVNNDSLTKNFNEPFREFYYRDGEMKNNVWNNYQTYLLSPTYPNGSKRSIEDTPLHTPISKITPEVPFNFIQKYSTLTTLEFPRKIIVKTPEAPTAPVAPITPVIGKYDLNGTTENTYDIPKLGEVVFTATGPEDIMVDDENPKFIATRDVIIGKFKKSLPDASEKDLIEKANGAIIGFIKKEITPVVAAPEAPIKNTFGSVIDQINKSLGNKTPLGIYENSPRIIFEFDGKEPSSPSFLIEPITNETTKKGTFYRIKTSVYNVLIDDAFNIVKVTSDKGKVYTVKENELSTVDIQSPLFDQLTKTTTDVVKPPVQPKTTTEDKFDGAAPKEDNYRRIGRNDKKERITEAELALFKTYVAENAPAIPYEALENIITTHDNEKAWGVFEDGVAKFYKGGLRGTEYHELGHGIWLGFLSPEERAAIIEDEKSRGGTFTDRTSGKKIEYSKATDIQIEERIMDDFAEFRKGKLPARSLSEKVVRFFKIIFDFFRSFVNNPSLKEELFKAIDTGRFKETKLSESAKNEDPRYSPVEGLSVARANEFIQDMLSRSSNIIFGERKEDIYEFKNITSAQVFNEIKELYSNEFNKYGESKFELLGEKTWKDLIQKTKESLRTLLGVQFNDEDMVDINNESTNNREYGADPFSIGRKNASFGMKLAVGTLPLTTNEKVPQGSLPKRFTTDIGYKLLNYATAFATIMDRVSNTTAISKAVEKIANLAKYDGNYVRFFKRIGGNEKSMTVDFSKFKSADWRVFIDFMQTFAKQKPEVFVQYTNGNEVYLGAANLQTAANKLQNKWIQNIRNLAKKEDALIKYAYKTKTFSANVAAFDKVSIQNTVDKIKFLNNLGITLSIETFTTKLSEEQQNKVTSEADSIYEYLKKVKELSTITDKTLDIKGRFRTIAEIIVKATNPIQDGTYMGVDGKTRQANAQNNALSLFANQFNEAGSLDELLITRPELKDVFSTSSIILKKGGQFFDKNGIKIPGKKLIVKLISGGLDELKDKGTSTIKLSRGSRFSQEVNQNINGNYYVINAADGNLEWEMGLGNSIAFADVQGDIAWTNIHSTFRGYLEDDVALALDYKNREKLYNVTNGGKDLEKAKELRFFKDILSKKTLDAINNRIAKGETQEQINKYIKDNIGDVNDAITAYVKDRSTELLDVLLKQSQISYVSENKYKYLSLETKFAKQNELKKLELTAHDVESLTTFTTVNSLISNIEYHKILFGDPYQFAIKEKKGEVILDETKRVKSFDSPRETTFDHPEFNNYHNIEYNKTGYEGDADRITLSPRIPDSEGHAGSYGDIGYDLFKPYINTVTLADTEVIGMLLGKTNESDAASIMRDTMYRQTKLRNKNWPKESETWHQWQMAYTRKQLSAKKVYTYTNEALRKHDLELTSKPSPTYITDIIKPIVTGSKYNSNAIDLVLDKDSQQPIYYSMVEGKELENLYIKMWKEDKDYVIALSGRKVGAEQVHNLYVGGKFNTEPFNNNIQVPWQAYGIQVETAYDSKGGELTAAVQVPKIVTMNLFENGKPYTKDPTRAEEIQKLYDKHDDVKKRQLQNGYNTLLKKLGIKDNGLNFDVKDKLALSESLEYEMLRRAVSENIKDTTRLDANGEFIIPFEASYAYKQIKDIIYSMLDKSITHPKTNGGNYTQAPVTMWENINEGRRIARKVNGEWKTITGEEFEKLTPAEKKGVVLTDDTLKFYTKKEPWCEIMLPHWFKKELGKSKKFDTDKKILDYLNSTVEGQSILRGVGFRIPVQLLSSIESFVVTGFLPESMGKTVIVPSEITTKAGSDFDIDKLNLYLKAIYIDKNGDIRLINQHGSEKGTKDFYAKVFDDKLEGKKIKKAELMEAVFIRAGIVDDHDNLSNRYGNLLNVLLEDVEDPIDYANSIMKQLEKLGDVNLQESLKEEFVNGMYKKSLENEYYETLEKLLSLPEQFDQLVTPVDDAGLKDLSLKLDELRGLDDNRVKNRVINSVYLTNLRHAFSIAKSWVGIVASNISNHSLAQKGNLYIDPARFSAEDKKFLGDGSVLLPHNTVTIDGEEYITVSGVKTADKKEFISDRLSGHATAVLDVAKDPFILKIIKSNLVPGVVMFLERIGTGQEGLVFMNQPIIDEYLTNLDNIGANTLFKESAIDSIKERFKTTEDLLASATMINKDEFENNIRKYNTKAGLSDAENAEQHKILDEFLKYAKMAEHLFDVNQALSYDTTRFANGDALTRKQYRTQKALDSNIFAGVKEILDNTFLQTQADFLDDSVEAIGEILPLEKAEFTNITNQVLDPYMKNKYLGGDAFTEIGNKIKLSFLDFIVQTKSGINEDIASLLNDTSTSIAVQLTEAQQEYPDMQILKDLEVVPNPRVDGTKSVQLSVNLRNDPYNEDLYTGYMRELRDNAATEGLYNNLVKVALLQGMYKSTISIGNIIPVEDYSREIAPIMKNLKVDLILESFANGWFQKNNFNDQDIFRRIEPRFKGSNYDPMTQMATQYSSLSYFPKVEKLNILSSSRQILTLKEGFNTTSDYVGFPKIITQTWNGKPTGVYINAETGRPVSGQEFERMSKTGDISGRDFYGYEKVKHSDGSPLVVYKNEQRHHVYKLTNLYGDGRMAVEYYGDNRPSVLNNGTVEAKEFTNDEIINAFSNLSEKLVPRIVNEITIQPSTSVKPTIDLSREWKGDLESRPVYTSEGVNTMRSNATNAFENFGNPFSEAGYGGTIKVASIGKAVIAYKEWLLGDAKYQEVKPQQRDWILDQINQGKLDGATLLYAGKSERRNEGMHPTALAEVVEQLRGTQPTQAAPAVSGEREAFVKDKINKLETRIENEGADVDTAKDLDAYKKELGLSPVYEPTAANFESGNIDVFQYFGKMYNLTIDDLGFGQTVATSVIGYKGDKDAERKILNSYDWNPNVDPQNGKPFRTVKEPEELKESKEPKKSIFESRAVSIDYTPGQEKALTDIGKLIDANKQGYYLLAGYAGTGKTTIAENIARYSMQSGRPVNVLAPTNKAAKVLNDKLKAAGVSSEASTIHKSIYGEPDPITGEWIPKADLKNSVIIVDESSMISKELMADLLNATRRNNIIVFMGDRFQLEPVGEDSGLFAGKVSEVKDSQSELTDVKRQSLDSNVLKIATLTRIDNKGYVPTVSMEDFKVSKSRNEFINDFKESIRNNENSVCIVATNAERMTMNEIARMEKFGPNRKVLEDGEVLIAVANSSDIPNSEIFTAKALRGDLEKQSLTFKFGDKSETYDVYVAYVVGEDGLERKTLHFPKLDKPSLYHAQILKAMRESNPDMYANFDNGRDITYSKKGPKLSASIVISTYGYSITAHKSQGSQWDKVFVNQNYNAPTWNAARWYYTAITRSAKDVIVLPSGNNSRISPADIETKALAIATPDKVSKDEEKDLNCGSAPF